MHLEECIDQMALLIANIGNDSLAVPLCHGIGAIVLQYSCLNTVSILKANMSIQISEINEMMQTIQFVCRRYLILKFKATFFEFYK